jgi:cytochrome c-type biogenesis protein CcmE
MDRLDEELKQALEQHPSQFEAPTSETRAKGPSRIRLLVGLLVMGGLVLLVVLTGLDNAAVYSKGVAELIAEKGRLKERNVRVVGTLVKGSLARRQEPCEYRFRLSGGGQLLEVHYPKCIIPDTFRDMPDYDVEVTTEGHLTADGTFLAHQIMAKCPSKYEMKQKVNAGNDAPHVAPPTSMNTPEPSWWTLSRCLASSVVGIDEVNRLANVG